jgi:hypothetical protein
MQKSNKSIAGYHLLMILSSVDGEFAPEEGMLVQQYLADEFPFRMNLDNELKHLRFYSLKNGKITSNSTQDASMMILQKMNV